MKVEELIEAIKTLTADELRTIFLLACSLI